MRTWPRYFTIAMTMSLLAGCGTTNVAIRPDVTREIHSIALVKVSELEMYSAQDFGNPGIMFGAVGGAVAGSSSANAGKSLNQIVMESDYSAADHFTASLMDRISASGYKVELVEVARNDRQKLLDDYSTVSATGADAVLDVAIESIGYATEHPMFSPHWRPASQVKVALIDSRSGKTLYSEKFMYGYHNPFMSGTDIDAPKTYHFKNKDDLFADSDKLVAGIRHAVEDLAEQIHSRLKK